MMTITLGWWVIPLIITIIVFTWAKIKVSQSNDGYMDISALVFYPPAIIIISLVSWLIWAIIN